MNFDDIMNGELGSLENNNIGKDLTDIFGVDTDSAKRSVRDLIKLTIATDSTDSDIINGALGLSDTREEVAVLMHLLTKALMSEVTSQANEMADLLDDTRIVLEEMPDEAQEEFAKGMISRMMERMDGEDE